MSCSCTTVRDDVIENNQCLLTNQDPEFSSAVLFYSHYCFFLGIDFNIWKQINLMYLKKEKTNHFGLIITCLLVMNTIA